MSRLLQERHRGYRQAEIPLQEIKQAGSFRVALCYPNLYFVGMSNLGFHSVYQMLNTHPDVLCERAFLPDDVDREDLERTGHPLTTVESGSAVSTNPPTWIERCRGSWCSPSTRSASTRTR